MKEKRIERGEKELVREREEGMKKQKERPTERER